jgi:hypothetical protein
MKKSYLYTGITYLLIGLLIGMIAGFSNTKLESLLWGFAGAGVAGGIGGLGLYFYWTRPKNKIRYKEHLESETIELHDERKEKFRNQSGRYAYILGLVTICISIVIFSMLESLEIIHHTKILNLYLYGYFVFQYIAGIIIFRHLNKKY